MLGSFAQTHAAIFYVRHLAMLSHKAGWARDRSGCDKQVSGITLDMMDEAELVRLGTDRYAAGACGQGVYAYPVLSKQDPAQGADKHQDQDQVQDQDQDETPGQERAPLRGWVLESEEQTVRGISGLADAADGVQLATYHVKEYYAKAAGLGNV